MKRSEFLKRYPGQDEDRILNVVLELGGDIDAKEFSKEVVALVDEFFGVLDTASKQLPPAPNGQMVVSEVVAIAKERFAEQGLTLSDEMLYYLLEPVRLRAKNIALTIQEVEREVFEKTLRDESVNYYREVGNHLWDSTEDLQQKFSRKNITKMVDKYLERDEKTTEFNLEAFYQEMEERGIVVEETPTLETKFDYDALVAEVEAKKRAKEEGKEPEPKPEFDLNAFIEEVEAKKRARRNK